MGPHEAYIHLNKTIEQVNAVMGSFFQGERMEDDLRWRERVEERVSANSTKDTVLDDPDNLPTSDVPAEYEEKSDEHIYFAPENNNVIFSSAIDGWAFTPRQFAAIYDKKLGMKREILEKTLWGDFYLDPKTKRVLGSKHLKGRNLKPMFVQLVLEPIWAVYEATTGGDQGKGDPALLEKITKSLNLTIPQHIKRSRDPRALLTTVFASWLPLSTALLVSVIEHLPSPVNAQAARIPPLLEASPGSDHIDPKITTAMTESRKSTEEPVVAYVSKMVSVPESELPINKRRGGALTAEEARELGRKKRAEIAKAQALAEGENADVDSMADALSTVAIGEDDDEDSTLKDEEAEPEDREHLVGFARLYSGTLTVGQEVYVLPPKFTPANPRVTPEPKKVTITALYLLMGRSLEALNSVPAGSIVGIGGLEGAILKSGTLCSQLDGAPNLSSSSAISTNAPIVRVAVEPAWPADLDKMVKGLRLLEQADPAVLYEQLESGEHVILTAGELHLERCLKDLRERFAKCDVQAGEVIVPYREGITNYVASSTTEQQEEMNPPKYPELGRGRIDVVTTSKQITVRLSVRPLPDTVTNFLVKNTAAVKRLYSEKKAGQQDLPAAVEETEEHDTEHEAGNDVGTVELGRALSMQEFKAQLSTAFAEVKGDKDIWQDAIERITAFGPRRVGPNVLIDATQGAICGKFLRDVQDVQDEKDRSDDVDVRPDQLRAQDFVDKITYAFQLATNQGPLCNEPMQGVAVFIEDITINKTDDEPQNMGRLTGEVIKSTRDSIRQGFLDWSPRLLLAMYSCEIQASAEVLGRVYAVITRRRGKIISESLLEPSPNFTILALLPVAESFGFSDEIRKRTSGAASPQLIFEGFEMLDEDPFWVPRTEEEIEDLGEKGDRENVAKRYVDTVRERKGLFVQRKVVEHGEKQKTLKR
ncbi:elongation factor Tu [Aureobasidium sp. EXF-8846]|nr:elongation factor Tu [Aureobasidium sp. EXF-8846]